MLKIIFILTLYSFSLKAQTLTPFQFTDFGEKWGYIDKQSKEVKIFWHFDSIFKYENGIYMAFYNGKLGGIDSVGNIVIPFTFKNIKFIGPTNFVGKYYKKQYVFRIIGNSNLIVDDSIFATDDDLEKPIIDLNSSALKKVIYIKDSSESVILKQYMNKLKIEKMSKVLPGLIPETNRIHKTIQIGAIDNASRHGFFELKAGVFYQYKKIFSGLSFGLQRTKVFGYNENLVSTQIPLYISQMYFLKPIGSTFSPYFKYDIGIVLSNFNSIQKRGPNPAVNQFAASNALLLNSALGIKIGKPLNQNGFILELGYKLLPSQFIKIQNHNYWNILFGYLF